MSEVIFLSPDDFGVCRSLVIELEKLHADRAVHEAMHRWRELRAAEGEQVAPLGECEHWQAVTRAEQTIRQQCFRLCRQGWQFVCSVAPSEASGLRHLADHAGLSERLEQVLGPLVRDRRGTDGGFMLAEAEKAVEPLLGDLRAAEAICRAALARNQSESASAEAATGGGATKIEQVHAFLLGAKQKGRTFKSQTEACSVMLKETGLRVGRETFSQALRSAPAGLAEVVRCKPRKQASVRACRLTEAHTDRTGSRTERDPAELAAEAEQEENRSALRHYHSEFRDGSKARRAEIVEAMVRRWPGLAEHAGSVGDLLRDCAADQAVNILLGMIERVD